MSFEEFYDSLELQCLSIQEVAELCFEAGASSHQGEVDEAFSKGYHSRQDAIAKLENKLADSAIQCDELQKRINQAISAIMNDKCSHTVIDTLRGE